MNEIPLLRLCIPLILGIFCGLELKVPQLYGLSALLVVLCTIISYFFYKKRSFSRRWRFGMVLWSGTLGIGTILGGLSDERESDWHYSKTAANASHYLLRINTPPELRTSSIRLNCDVQAALVAGKWVSCKGQLLSFLLDTGAIHTLHYGDLLVIKNKLQTIPRPPNPHQFDFRRHMSRKNVYQEVFLYKGEFSRCDVNTENPIFSFAYKLKQKLIDTFRKGLRPREMAVATALLIGDTNDIDDDTYNAFKNTGVLHILSVSGLHVGMLFIVINWLLSAMGRKVWLRYTRFVLIILLLWFYALLTGLAPPVLRASLMLTLLQIAKIWGLRSNAINTLAATAILLIGFNPLVVVNTGFQLSFLAVLGILAFERRIYLWEPAVNLFSRSKTALKIWQLIAVSIAAQLSTTPLSIYYFHQFPSYFIPANLIVTPLSSVALLGALASSLFSWIPNLGEYINYVTQWSTYILNEVVHYFELLPYSTLSDLFMSKAEAILISVSLCLLWVYAFIQSRLISFSVFLAFAIAVTLNVYNFNAKHSVKAITLYSIRKMNAVEILDQQNALVLSSGTKLQIGNKEWEFNIHNNLINERLKHLTLLTINSDTCFRHFNLSYNNGFLYFKKELYFWLNAYSESSEVSHGNPIKLKALIVSDNLKIKPERVLAHFEPQQIILDASNKKYTEKKWLQFCKERGIPLHLCSESGYWQYQIN